TTTACPAASIQVVQGSGQSGVTGGRLGTALIARVADASGNAIVGATVTWSGNGSVSNATTVTDAAGRVSADWTLGSTSGTQTMRAGLPCGSATFTATVRKPIDTVAVTPAAPSVRTGVTTQLT